MEPTRTNFVSAESLNSFPDKAYFNWLGYRTDIKELLEKSDIFLFPSYYMEGLPKSCIEANAVGRPIITTDSVGCRDTVIDGYNGFIIPVKDSKALAEKIAILAENEELRIKMGVNARKYAEDNFDVQDVIRKHLAIYQELLSTSK